MNDATVNDTRKAELLSTQVEHIDIKSFDARPIIDQMANMSFTSRDLARATGIYNQMLADKDCTVCLVIAGSTSAARRPGRGPRRVLPQPGTKPMYRSRCRRAPCRRAPSTDPRRGR